MYSTLNKQTNSTRFAHMTIDQLKEKARDNNLRRCILRSLILESDFAQRNSKFDLLVQDYKDCAPVFATTVPQRQMRHYYVKIGERKVRIIVNLRDAFTQEIWRMSQDHVQIEVQGLFGIDHSLSLQLGEGPLLDLVSSLTKVASGFLNFASDTVNVVSIASFVLRSVRLIFSKTFDVMEAVLLMIEGLARVSDVERIVELAQGLAVHLKNVYLWMHNKICAQNADVEPIASLATILCVLFGSSVMKSVPKGSQIDEVVTGSIKFGNLMKGLSGSWAVIEKVALFVFDKIFEWQYGVPPHIAKLEECVSGITQWYKDVQTLVSLHTPDQIATDSMKCAEVETLFAQGVRYSAMIGEFKFDRNILAGFQTHFRVLQACYDRAQSSGAFRGGPRIEPIVIQLHGESGVGKSGMMFPLAIDLLKVDGIPNNDFTQQIYNRNVEQEFWDGYRGQRVTIYDDFGQMRDSQANPNLEFMELIRTGNLAPYPLHMATIEDKAKTYFKSRVVLITSNTAVFRPESLTWPDAVRRRVDLSAEVCVKRRFAKYDREANVWRVDPVKVFAITGEHHSMDVYDVYLCDPQTGHHISRTPISYEEFAAQAQQLYRIRFERSSKLFSFLQKRADAPLEAQMHVPEIQEGGKIVMRNVDDALMEFTMLDFAMFCDFGFEQSGSIFDQETRMWMSDTVRKVKLNQVTIDEGLALFKAFADAARYRSNVEQHIADLFDRADPNDPLGFLELDVLSRWDWVCHFVHERRVTPTGYVYQMQQRLLKSVAGFSENMTQNLQRAKEALKKARWYHFALASLPVVAVVWYLYSKDKKHPAHDRITRSSAMTTEDVTFLMNSELSSSGDPKTHTVRKTQVEVDVQCPSCMQQVLFDSEAILTHKMTCELSSSGDPKTLNAKKTVVELEGEEEECSPFLPIAAGAAAFTIGYGALKVASAMSRKLEAQLQLDPNAFAVSKKVLNNLYEFQLEIDNKWGPRMKICMLKGRVGLTVAHLKPYLEKATRARIYNHNIPDGHVFKIERLTWEVVKDVAGNAKDQLLVCFPKDLHDHADVTGSIADSVTMSAFKRTTAVLCVPFEGGALMKYGEIKACDTNVVQYVDGNREYAIRDRYEYTTLETTRGDCGSILIAIGSHLPKKILGIHIAGNVGLGVASPLSINDIQRSMARFPIEAHLTLDLDPFLTEQKVFEEIQKPEGNFVSVGVSKICVKSPTKTALRPSKCVGRIVFPSTAPSVLTPVLREGKRIDPMFNGLKKAGKIPPSLNEAFLDAAINDFARIVCSNKKESDCRILSNLEAVTGVEGDDCMPPIKRSSSAGYPWIAERKGIGKTKWLGSDSYCLSPDVEFVMLERERLAKQGIRYPTFWVDTLKDERRPLDKIEAVKTRVFSAGSMDFTLSFRKFFLGFAAHCCRNRIENEISVGTNVYSQDWSRTAKKCTLKGNKVIAGDFSNFDGTLLLPILYRILDIVNEFYDDGEENALIRHVLWKEIINSVHVCGDSVYMWTHSQPSGCPITAILNSIYNSVSMRYCWMVIFAGKPAMQSMKMFNTHVSMVSYGDDNVINISDGVCEQFNQLSIAEAYATIGMTYTDESKSGEMVKYRDIHSVAYLKRKFVWNADELQWIAPLAMETVLEMTNWIRGDLDQEKSTVENLETSAFELSLHGEKVFDELIVKYKRATDDFAEKPQLLTYGEYRHSEAVKYGRLNE